MTLCPYGSFSLFFLSLKWQQTYSLLLCKYSHPLLKAHYRNQQYYQLQTFSFHIYSPESFSLQNKAETHHGSHLFYFCLTKFDCCEENICGIHHSKNEFFLVICRYIELNVRKTDNHETKEITHRTKTLLVS